MTIVLKHFMATNGERFSQLYQTESNGFPLFYPTAYCSRNLRTRCAHNTQVDYLLAIKKLYEWTEQYSQTGKKQKLDIHERLLSLEFFDPYEIDSLVQFISLKRSSTNGETIKGTKINTRLSVISNYLCWYAEEIITNPNRIEVQTKIAKMAKMIAARKRGTRSEARRREKTISKKINKEARAELLYLFNNPFSGLKRESNRGSRIRNITQLRILYETGMRVGELHGLRLGDFEISSGGEAASLSIQRYHDDPYDDRRNQPAAKTQARLVPISEELSLQISIYLKEWRSNVPNVGFEDRDFIFVVHRKGERQGKASTISSFNSSLEVLKRQMKRLSQIHPHLLRHDWNYRFSLLADELGYSEKEEATIREYLMGWVDDSSSAALYNRRRIQEQAFKVGRRVAYATSRKG